jgi:hypothetical protein
LNESFIYYCRNQTGWENMLLLMNQKIDFSRKKKNKIILKEYYQKFSCNVELFMRQWFWVLSNNQNLENLKVNPIEIAR